MKKVLITGGLGFIGSNLAERLAVLGYEVQVFDNLSRDMTEVRWPMLRRLGVSLVRGDVRNRNDWTRLDNPDVVFHYAGNPGIPWSIEDPQGDFEANVIGTFNAVQFARGAGAGLIFASTNRVYSVDCGGMLSERKTAYFSIEHSMGVGEAAILRSGLRSPYGASKLAADTIVQEWGHTFGVPTICNRMGVIYGPGQYGATEQGWVGFFARQKVENNPVVIYGNGKQVRDPLYIDDLLDLLITQLESIGDFHGAVFNVGGGIDNAASVIEIADKLGLKYSFGDERPADTRWYITDASKAKKTFDWYPKTPLDFGLSETVEFFNRLTKSTPRRENV